MQLPRSLRSQPPEGARLHLGNGPAVQTLPPLSLRSRPPEGARLHLGNGPAVQT